jgi:hypothetical protein
MGEITQAQAAAIAAPGSPTPVVLTDAATIATALVGARMNQEYQVTIAGNRTMGIPTNPVDGLVIVYRIKNDTGARTITWTTGAGGFLFGLSIPLVNVVLGTAGANSYDLVAWKYNAALDRLVCVGAVLGFV